MKALILFVILSILNVGVVNASEIQVKDFKYTRITKLSDGYEQTAMSGPCALIFYLKLAGIQPASNNLINDNKVYVISESMNIEQLYYKNTCVLNIFSPKDEVTINEQQNEVTIIGGNARLIYNFLNSMPVYVHNLFRNEVNGNIVITIGDHLVTCSAPSKYPYDDIKCTIKY